MTDFARLPPYRVQLASASFSSGDGVDWGLSSLGVPELWKRTSGAGVTVAVIDSGIGSHPALSGAVKASKNFSPDDTDADTLGHGTHVAGIIAARGGPAKGIAPGCSLINCKALGHSGMGANAGVADAVRFAVAEGADIISMSLGSAAPDLSLHAAIKDASEAGVIVVCAAGNDAGPVNFPAAFQETIAVGAVRKDGTACLFSCQGAEIVVAAPGEDITSTWINGGYATVSGTSMAAPFVSGTLALYVADARSRGEKVNLQTALHALAKTSTDAGPPGRDHVYGWGLINPAGLVGYAAQGVPGVTIFIPGGRVV